MRGKSSLAALALFLAALNCFATDFHVTATGTAAGDGSLAKPWDIRTAFAGGNGAVKPCDVINLHGPVIWPGMPAGVYGFIVDVNLQGTAACPVTVQGAPLEAVTLDMFKAGAGGGSSGAIYLRNYPNPAGSHYVTFKDFTIDYSNPSRFEFMPFGIVATAGDHFKFINLRIRNTGTGIAFGSEGNPSAPSDIETYGVVVTYNGWNGSNQYHGIYEHTSVGVTKVLENISAFNSSFGLHLYPHSTNGSFPNLTVQGNVAANNGDGWTGGHPGSTTEILVGGEVNTVSPVFDSNYEWHQGLYSMNYATNFGQSAGCTGLTATKNFLMGTTLFVKCGIALLTGNTFIGPVYTEASYGGANSVLDQAAYPSNTYLSGPPAQSFAFVRPNAYDSSQGNVIVYNFPLAPTVAADFSKVVKLGHSWALYNAFNWDGPFSAQSVPVQIGTNYAGGNVDVKMQAYANRASAGYGTPPPTGPKFNVFILRDTGGAAMPSPSPSPTAVIAPQSTPTPTSTSSPTATASPSATVTQTSTRTWTPTPTATPTPTLTGTPATLCWSPTPPCVAVTTTPKGN